MVQKEYSSGQYFAERFRDYVLDYFQKKKGYRPKIRQSKDSVTVTVAKQDYTLDFSGVDSRDVLRVTSPIRKNGFTNEIEYRRKVDRTNTGKISDNTLRKITESFLIKLIKES